MDTNNLQLNEEQRSRLDGIVGSMVKNKEPDEAIKFVVNDFKQKYGSKPRGFFGKLAVGTYNAVNDIFGVKKNESTGFIPSVLKSTIGSEGIAGVAQLPGKAIAAVSEYTPGIGDNQGSLLQKQASDLDDQAFDLLQRMKTEQDPEKKDKYRNSAKQLMKSSEDIRKNANEIAGFTDTTPEQALGTGLNAALTVTTGAKPNILGGLNPAFQTLSKGTSFVNNTARSIYYGGRVVENAVLGAGFNTAANLNSGKDLSENLGASTLIGAGIPLAGAAAAKIKSTVTGALKPGAEALINSLIKPLQKDFAYGKNPSRGILNEGIVANDLPSLQTQVNSKLSQIGEQIGTVGKELQRSGVSLDLSRSLVPLDEAMAAAAKSNNSTLLNSLNNVKTALTHFLKLGADDKGNAVINKGDPRDLARSSYENAVQFLSDVRDHTRFTGNPSDDKALNTATKRVYGITREIMNNSADRVNPKLGREIRDLNERYADLSSARSAIAHRDLVEKRQNILTLASKFTIPVAITGAVLSGSYEKAAIILASEIGLLGASKLLGSAAAKTRVAKFLNAIAPEEREAILSSNNPLNNWYQRLTGNQPAQVSTPKGKEVPATRGMIKPEVLAVGTGLGALGAAANRPVSAGTYTAPEDVPEVTPTNPNVVEGYDIKSYATDPKHEEKIQRIFKAVPETGIGAYIKSKFPKSPVTEAMILKASEAYGVPVRLLVAMMQQDSGLGTTGLGVKTKNPGNVGNTDDGKTRTYPSWEAGVMAVAKNLSQRKVK